MILINIDQLCHSFEEPLSKPASQPLQNFGGYPECLKWSSQSRPMTDLVRKSRPKTPDQLSLFLSLHKLVWNQSSEPHRTHRIRIHSLHIISKLIDMYPYLWMCMHIYHMLAHPCIFLHFFAMYVYWHACISWASDISMDMHAISMDMNACSSLHVYTGCGRGDQFQNKVGRSWAGDGRSLFVS